MDEMFKYENELLSVPINDLEVVLNRYLECVLPIVDNETYIKTEKICKDFSENEGRVLFDKIMDWKESLNRGSWLSPLQVEGFLSVREPVTIMGNYAGILKPDNNNHIKDGIELTAAFIYATIKIYLEIENETFKPILMRNKTPVSMKPFKDVFNSCRVPKKGVDEIVSYKNNAGKGREVCFFHNGRHWSIEVVDSDGNICEYKDILHTIKTIVEENQSNEQKYINSLSVLGSDKASYLIGKIIDFDDKNQLGFDKLNDSIFNISYLEDDILSDSEEMHDLLYGNGEKIWCYKPWSISVKKDRRIRYNMEHTLMDGLNSIYLLGCIRDIISNGDLFSDCRNGKFLTNTKIDWNISDEIKNEIINEKDKYLDQVSKFRIKKISFDDYGKEKIAGCGYSADAIFRFALQYAQQKVFKRIRTEYESCDIRHYYEGRVTGIRPVSKDSVSLIDSIIDNDDSEIIVEKLRVANNTHKSKIKNCKQANSVTRPLNVLKSIYEKHGKELGLKEIPEFFSDISFKKINSDFLSTTTVGEWDSMLFSPVIKNGLGLVYAIREESIELFASYELEDEDDFTSFFDEVIDFLRIVEKHII